MSRFQKAVRRKRKLRLALIGPTGAGKTYTALSLAAGLGRRVAVVCTEFGSASLYSNRFDFDVVDLDDYAAANFIECVVDAGKSGYDVLVIDSLSHAWAGKNGILEFVDRAAKRNQGNSFSGWRDATPLHNRLVEAVLACPCHVIVTLRSKMDYVVEKDERTGKQVPRKVGLQPVQRDGLEYEFDLVCDVDLDHNLIVGKTRFEELDGLVVNRPGPDVGAKVLALLDAGVAAPSPFAAVPPPPAKKADDRTIEQFVADAAQKIGAQPSALRRDVVAAAVEAGHLDGGLRDDEQTAAAVAFLDAHRRDWVRKLVVDLVKANLREEAA